ncbi:Ammonium transporter 2 [Wickerhamiella sorbophila]|uniref:Ammonium transporter 2 n=1 Tax=Wickerhamiella sorbophila TaxID=45607 RepID=A0A2T0FFJ3_9ASCO|nr:Ammonium transporter 2 [Wickerhamiella sorbophila]PRT53758.1 Ammonium transporter 2 [Wickerhamiella sorbophila]
MNEDELDQPSHIVFYLFIIFSVLMLQGGIALFYTGLTSGKAALTQAAYAVAGHVVTVLQFFIIGYSLVRTENSGILGNFVGGLKYTFFRNIAWDNTTEIITAVGPAFIHTGFAGVCCAIMFGAVHLRASMPPSLLFQFFWLTLVYCPAAYWAWNASGWANQWGVLDYAGGTVVHCVAGFTALAYASKLGTRLGYENYDMHPFNLLLVIIGTFMMIMGWIGFNGGATMAPSAIVLLAVTNTAISASAGGVTWLLLDHSFDGEWSLVGLCSGVVSGLVCITSGAAFVEPYAAIFFGAIGAFVCNLSTQVKFRLKIDDALDVFAVHGIGGFAGTILTGIFASPKLTENKGLVYGNFAQPFKQLVHIVVLIFYVLIVSNLILRLFEFLGLELRVDPDDERIGLDLAEHGETLLHNPSEPRAGVGMSSVAYDGSMNRYLKPNTNTSMVPTADTPLLDRMSREVSHL